MSDEINRRNQESVFAKLEEINGRVYDQAILFNQMQNTLHALISRFQELEHKVNVLAIRDMGHGPTER